MLDNSIMTISPYMHEGMWVFDDDSVDLVKEPFVAGIPEMINVLISDIDDAKDGFNLIFSSDPFPGYDIRLNILMMLLSIFMCRLNRKVFKLNNM